MLTTKFYNYLTKRELTKRENFKTKSVFGDIGLFSQNAMFALVRKNAIYIRGGGELDEELRLLHCRQYIFIKKQSTAKVSYYDITKLFLSEDPQLEKLIHRAKNLAICHKQQKVAPSNRRLRDLPNLHLTIERMLKKSEIPDVASFFRLGAIHAYLQVRQVYGSTANIRLLWKFAGAIEGIHWSLIQDDDKNRLLAEYQDILRR
jgi:DNA transformation protein